MDRCSAARHWLHLLPTVRPRASHSVSLGLCLPFLQTGDNTQFILHLGSIKIHFRQRALQSALHRVSSQERTTAIIVALMGAVLVTR